jgi:hypothetical protein
MMNSDTELRTKKDNKLIKEIRENRPNKMQNKKEIEDDVRPPFICPCLVQLEKLHYYHIYLFLVQYY